MTTHQLTKQGFEKLKGELEQLQTVKKPSAIEALQKARAMGDLSENSAYTTARDELSSVEGRIRELQAILETADVVDETVTQQGVVGLGSKVEVICDNEKETYELVGEYEADPMKHKVSSSSPLGSALMGHKQGDKVTLTVPAGTQTYQILSVL